MADRAKIRRGAQPRRPRPVIKQRRPSMAPRAKASASRALATIPVPLEKLQLWAWRLLWLLVAIAAIVLLLALHVPALAGNALGEAAGSLGLSVKRVQVTGIRHLDQLTVDAIALDQPTSAMPLVDLDAIREKLLKFGWVADARVSRRLPDTLLIDIVERKPAAIWQYHGKLELIDKDGTDLAPIDIAHMPDLPVVVGPDANRHVPELSALLDAAPQLKPMFAGASWIGDRRWDVRFQSGETLALPEGEDASKAAFAKFQRMDQASPLLGRNYSHFDMRIEQRFAARFKSNAGAAIAAAAAGKSKPDDPAASGADKHGDAGTDANPDVI